ncbi:unnamed protein product, partial [Coregonus sp. 'balchen']
MQINQLLQNLDFYVTPVLNIDGYTRLWRKSRSPPPEGCSCYGVDLNRNFNVNWGMIGVSFDCCHDNYCGTGAVSQMESQAVTEFVKVGKAAAELTKSVHGMNYRVGTSPQVLYPNSGSSRDWAHLIGIPFSYTFELRDKGQFGHLLPEYQIQPACEEAFVGALSIITYVQWVSAAEPRNARTSGSSRDWLTHWIPFSYTPLAERQGSFGPCCQSNQIRRGVVKRPFPTPPRTRPRQPESLRGPPHYPWAAEEEATLAACRLHGKASSRGTASAGLHDPRSRSRFPHGAVGTALGPDWMTFCNTVVPVPETRVDLRGVGEEEGNG